MIVENNLYKTLFINKILYKSKEIIFFTYPHKSFFISVKKTFVRDN